MAVLIKHFDKFEFSVPLRNAGGACDLKLYRYNQKNLLMATERMTYSGSYVDEDGPGLVDSIEYIATGARKAGMEWVFFLEHIPTRGNERLRQIQFGPAYRPIDSMFTASWTLVNFTLDVVALDDVRFTNPQFEHISEDVVRQLLGFVPDYYDPAWGIR